MVFAEHARDVKTSRVISPGISPFRSIKSLETRERNTRSSRSRGGFPGYSSKALKKRAERSRELSDSGNESVVFHTRDRESAEKGARRQRQKLQQKRFSVSLSTKLRCARVYTSETREPRSRDEKEDTLTDAELSARFIERNEQTEGGGREEEEEEEEIRED